MTSIGQAAAAASIIAGMVSVPAVSQTASPSSGMQMGPANISGSTPSREVVRRSDSDGFYGSIETSFSSFASHVRQGSANATLTSPSARLTVERSPKSTVWRLRSPSGDMTVRKSSTGVVKRLETPYGTLKKVRRGARYENVFRGESREKVERTAASLESLMESRRSSMKSKAHELAPGAGGGAAEARIEVLMNESTASGYGNNSMEHAVLVNRGSSVDLEGWELGNNNPSFYEFGDVTLESGERLKVYSGNVDAESAVTGTDIAWENGGDKATLKNPQNRTVEASSF